MKARRPSVRSRPTCLDLALAFGAEVGAASGDFDALDGRAADVAGQAGAPEDFDLELVPALAAAGVEVVAEAGAAVAEGDLESLADCGVESPDALSRKRVGGALRADAGEKERFVGVDVADAGYRGLVEQCRLHGCRAAFEERMEV